MPLLLSIFLCSLLTHVALVSLYVLAYVAAGLIEAGLDPSRPRGFRVFDCLDE